VYDHDEGDYDDASVQPNMLCLDTNVIIYVNVVTRLMVVTSMVQVYNLTALKLNSRMFIL
jgi:hypothetical protein